jgi:hypothetical protein
LPNWKEAERHAPSLCRFRNAIPLQTTLPHFEHKEKQEELPTSCTKEIVSYSLPFEIII